MTQEMKIKNGSIKLDTLFLVEQKKWLLGLQVADVKFKIIVPDPSDPSDKIQLISVQDPYKSSFSLPAVKMARRKKFESQSLTTTTIIVRK